MACSAPVVQVYVLRHSFSNVHMEFYCIGIGYDVHVMESSQFCRKFHSIICREQFDEYLITLKNNARFVIYND